MKTRWFLALVSLLCLALTLTACTGTTPANLMANVKAAEWPANPNPPDPAYTQAVRDFSWKFFQTAVGTASKPGNLFVSPASIYLALAMTLNGSDGQTRADMLTALASQGLSADTINQASRDWITLLNTTSDKTRLSIANSIWYRSGFNIDAKFLQTNADFFNAGARTLDFSKPEAVTTINQWVKDQTAGKIDKIIDKIDDNVIMYLLNAIYFKSDWKNPFEANKTGDREFRASSGTVTTKFMAKQGSFQYIDMNGRRGVMLPYVDERFAFFAILPADTETAPAMTAALSGQDLASLLASAKATELDLALPKFELRYEDKLADELTALGMGVAFAPGQADFSLMQPSRAKNLYINQVFHKTYCKVDEKGTEAAAVTGVEVGVTSMPPVNIQLNFDRPFLFGILDTQSNVPLFMGILDNPAA